MELLTGLQRLLHEQNDSPILFVLSMHEKLDFLIDEVHFDCHIIVGEA